MSVAWKLPDLNMTQKFVLIALCDSANDEGVCFPSVAALMRKCNLSERGVRKVTAELEQMGFLSKKIRNGHSTVYVVSPESGVVTPASGAPCTTCTPAPGAPTPARGAPPPLHDVHPTPAPGAPITQIEPKKEPSRNLTACAREEIPDNLVFDQPLQWAQFFITECGYPLHIVQTAKTIPLFAEWVRLGYSVGLIRQAMLACHAWNGGRVPDSPLLYRKFLQSILDEQKRLADDAVFADRPGAGRIRAIDDWAKVPKADDDLWPWAKQHGYPGPGSKTYRQYRTFLNDVVEKRLRERHREVAG